MNVSKLKTTKRVAQRLNIDQHTKLHVFVGKCFKQFTTSEVDAMANEMLKYPTS